MGEAAEAVGLDALNVLVRNCPPVVVVDEVGVEGLLALAFLGFRPRLAPPPRAGLVRGIG